MRFTSGYKPHGLWPLVVLIVLILMILLSMNDRVLARDNGQFANSALKPWFDQLRSGRGPCCSDADGTALSDIDWDTQAGKYRVYLHQRWIVVPDDAVITEPNLSGRTMVWPMDISGTISIRCFMPGPAS